MAYYVYRDRNVSQEMQDMRNIGAGSDCKTHYLGIQVLDINIPKHCSSETVISKPKYLLKIA